jgi:CPA2 family monovalent cation:H+ antiporter-2
MSDLGILRELVIVLAAVVSIVIVFQKLSLPAVVGFLMAGIILGPHGFALIRNVDQVETLAEIGLVLLLFTIGLEFSLAELRPIGRRVILAGILQVVLTIGVVLVVFLFFGYAPSVGIFYGFLIVLSSTAIVLKIYIDRQEINALHGRLATGVLLFQDLCLIPMMLLLPVLGQSAQLSALFVGWILIKALLALGMILVTAKTLLPWFLRQVALLRNREAFTLFVVFVCLGTAWLTLESGLSLAIGAFIAGLMVSESEFSHQIVADILPLRDCFSGIFFVSIGMLLNVEFLIRDILTPSFHLLLVVGVKGAIIFVVFWWLYQSPRLGVVLALSLAQIGEFSFILARAGQGYGLLTPAAEQNFLAASILSMIATPFLIQSVHGLGFGLQSMVKGSGTLPAGETESAIAGHVIVVGYGLNGQNLSRVLKEVGIPYKILDMDPSLVHSEGSAGEPISFGDGTRPEVLHRIGIRQARVLVIAVSDPVATARIVSQARRLRPELYIIVRTRYVAEIEHLYRLGASQVIPEEFETSVEIFARVLQQYHIPRNVIALQVDLIRREHYGTLRGLQLQGKRLDELSEFLQGTTTDLFLLTEHSPAVKKSLDQIELRSRAGVTVIAVVREGKSIYNPGSDFALAAGDLLVLLGSHKELDAASRILTPPDQAENSA